MDDLEKDFADLYNLSQEREDDGTITCIIYDDQFMDTAPDLYSYNNNNKLTNFG